MIIWINGTFGVGKTTTATTLCEQSSDLRMFDPEHVGYLLAGNLRDHVVDDFQDLPPWRVLVPKVIDEIARFTSSDIVAVQSVLVESYWQELTAGMTELGLDVVHVLLDCEQDELVHRIRTDAVESQAVDWRLEHLEAYAAARPWMTAAADLVIDTTQQTPADVGETILASLTPSVTQRATETPGRS